jgi:cytochrome c oxidase cbb3-type subunit I
MGRQMTQISAQAKGMTLGEVGLSIVLVLLAFLSLYIWAGAYESGFVFHAALFALASGTGAFAIVNRYSGRSAEPPPQTIDGKPNYNFAPVRFLSLAAMFWGIAGFAVGIYIACELAFPDLNLDLPWITFERLRPLHTSAVIFAFGGNVLLATSFYVVQRTCRARLAGISRPGSWRSAIIFSSFAGTGYLLGITHSKEYAEPEWYADILLVFVW